MCYLKKEFVSVLLLFSIIQSTVTTHFEKNTHFDKFNALWIFEKSKKQRDNIKNATKNFDYTPIADWL